MHFYYTVVSESRFFLPGPASVLRLLFRVLGFRLRLLARISYRIRHRYSGFSGYGLGSGAQRSVACIACAYSIEGNTRWCG